VCSSLSWPPSRVLVGHIAPFLERLPQPDPQVRVLIDAGWDPCFSLPPILGNAGEFQDPLSDQQAGPLPESVLDGKSFSLLIFRVALQPNQCFLHKPITPLPGELGDNFLPKLLGVRKTLKKFEKPLPLEPEMEISEEAAVLGLLELADPPDLEIHLQVCLSDLRLIARADGPQVS
jgi:hypothetical protein